MTIDFNQYVQGNCLNLKGKDTILSEILNNEENLNAFSSFIKTHSNITALNLAKCNIDSERIKLLIYPINNSNITDLDVSENKLKNADATAEIAKLSKLTVLNISDNGMFQEGADEIAKLTNLIVLNISHNYIDAAKIAKLSKLTALDISRNHIGDKGAEEIAKLSKLTTLDISYNSIRDKGAEEVAKLSKLTALDISDNFITDKGIAEIAKFLNLNTLNIHNNGFSISPYGIETLATLKKTDVDIGNIAGNLFLNLLKDNNVTSEKIKEIMFEAALCGNIELIKHIINSPEKYPFAINSRDGNGHSLLHFYNHKPHMQQFLFKYGIIPEQEQQHGRLKTLAQDKQSVHTKEAVALTNFNTNKLVKAYGNIENTQQLLTKAEAYHAGLTKLHQVYQDSIKLKLLSLTDGGKRDTLGKTLAANEAVPNDQDYVATVIDKAKIALTTKYLAKTNGQYNSGYPTHEMEYGDGHKITIPQSLGLVKSLIETMKIPVAEKRELLVTLMAQNPKLVENKLPMIQKKLGVDVTVEKLANRTECHKLLENTDLKIIEELFKNISGLDIDQTWREQKEFTLAERIYIAATTYGDNATACLHGVWDYIINSTTEINKEFYNEFIKLQEQELEKDKERNSITESNIQEFTSVSAKKLIDFVKDKSELRESLAELGTAMIDIRNPQEITIEQQKILAELNKAFKETIKTCLPNYDRVMPEFEEYDTIIRELAENNDLREFARNYYELQNQVGQLEGDTYANSLVEVSHQPTDEQTVKIIGGAESTGYLNFEDHL